MPLLVSDCAVDSFGSPELLAGSGVKAKKLPANIIDCTGNNKYALVFSMQGADVHGDFFILP
ncbi:hypothetical protein D3C81_1973230 [compost metagenome]